MTRPHAERFYLDYAAGGPARPEVVEIMGNYARSHFANPGAHHPMAYEAKHLLEDWRRRAADLLGANPREIVFCAGGTESDGLALRGVMQAAGRAGRNELVVSAIEHHAVLLEAERLAAEGFVVHFAPVTPDGVVDLSALRGLVNERTALVSVMFANNETGVIQPAREVADIAHGAGARFHCDAVQAFGKIDVRPATIGADLLSLSGQKFSGPKGVGLLYREMTGRLSPVVVGGPQEWGLRAGTENLPGIAGLVTAMELAEAERNTVWPRVETLRDGFEKRLRERAGDRIVIHGAKAQRLPNFSNVSFRGVEGQAMAIELGERGYSVGLGSACAPGETDPSHVLRAMGVNFEDALACLRFSFGPDIQEQQLADLATLCAAVHDSLAGLG